MAEIFKRFKTVTCNLQDPDGEWVSYKYYKQETDRLNEIIKCKDVLLVAYRLGTRKGVEKALDRLEVLKEG